MNEQELKEYIVTLYRHEDLDSFYVDMETPGGNLYIPGRAVNRSIKVKYSKSITYSLTKEESELLSKDSRVLSVNVVSKDLNLEAFSEIYSENWDKSYSLNSNDKNWALLRCTEGENRTSWGVTGDISNIPDLDNTNANVTGTAYLTSTGKNVDIVIVDIGHADPNSPEFLDSSGTASRYNQIDWYSFFDSESGVNEVYTYPTSSSAGSGAQVSFTQASSEDHNHAYHVTTIAAGKNQGWAKDANIYSFDINSTIGGSIPAVLYIFDLINAFHLSKPVNPETGIRNPTIVNNSWGSLIKHFIKDPNFQFAVEVRGVRTPATGFKSWETVQDESILASLGLRYITPVPWFEWTNDPANGDGILLKTPGSKYSSSLMATLESSMKTAIDNGVIFVAASGNHYCKICSDSSDPDWNNKIIYDDGITEHYYHRGTLSALNNCISVSNVSNFSDEKLSLRNGVGPRVDVFAPGVAIISSVHNNIEHSTNNWGGWETETTYPSIDISSNTYSKWSYNGSGATSMSAPQVTGVLACLLEHYPRMNQQDCRDFIQKTAKLGQIGGNTSDTSGTNWESDESLFGAENRYLYYKKQREVSGQVTSHLTNNARKSTGMMFPRRRFI